MLPHAQRYGGDSPTRTMRSSPSPLLAPVRGCLTCFVAVLRACFCLPAAHSYASTPSSTVAEDLLHARHQAPQSVAIEAASPAREERPPPPRGQRGAAAADRERVRLIPKAAERSDEKEAAAVAAVGAMNKSAKKASSLDLGLDDDLICPTCLDPYTAYNPQVVAKCGHSFHLPCIFEWQERSPNCPLCDRPMAYEV